MATFQKIKFQKKRKKGKTPPTIYFSNVAVETIFLFFCWPKQFPM